MGIDAEMFVRTKEKVTAEEVLSYARRLAACFGHGKFFIKHPRSEYLYDGPRHCLTLVDHIDQDGPEIWPEVGETFIRVHLWTRYYGEGYERGDLPLIVNVAEWLETTIPGGEVWYGGDSSGVKHERFGKAEREALWKHFIEVNHEPYVGAFSRLGDPQQLPVDECELCHAPFTRYGMGAVYGAYSCHGCGFHLQTRDGGNSWTYWFGENEKDAKPFTKQAA